MVRHAPAGAATLPTVSVNDVSITEGTGSTKTLTFTVTQSARGKSRASFTTVRDTAKAPADFLMKTGSVRFAGNKLTKTVSVTIMGDAFDEPDETFFSSSPAPRARPSRTAKGSERSRTTTCLPSCRCH